MPKTLAIYLEPAPYVLGFVAALRERGHDDLEVIYLSAAASQDWGAKLNDARDWVSEGEMRAALGHIYERLDRGDIGLLHLAGWGHPVLARAMLRARRRRIPVTVESDTPAPFFQPLWKAAVKRAIYPIAFKIPAMFFPGGTRQAAYLRQFGVPEKKITIAQMTVDVAHITTKTDQLGDAEKRRYREQIGLSADSIIALFVGRLEPHKGLHDLLTAFEQLRASISSGVQLSLLIVGDGALRELVERKASEENDIHYAGRLSGDQLWEAYGAADIFVLPSHFEPWGLVINEAMAAGLPVIVSDRAGCVADLVIGNQSGVVVEAENPQALAMALLRLVEMPEDRLNFARGARALISGWTLENEARLVSEGWQKVLTQ